MAALVEVQYIAGLISGKVPAVLEHRSAPSVDSEEFEGDSLS